MEGEKRQLVLNFNEEAWEKLERIRVLTGSKSKTEVIRRALRALVQTLSALGVTTEDPNKGIFDGLEEN